MGGVEAAVVGVGGGGVGVAGAEGEAGGGFPRFGEAAGVSSSWWGRVSHQWANTPPRPTAGSCAGSPTATSRQPCWLGEVDEAARSSVAAMPASSSDDRRPGRPAARSAVAVAGEEPGEGVGWAAGLARRGRRRPCPRGPGRRPAGPGRGGRRRPGDGGGLAGPGRTDHQHQPRRGRRSPRPQPRLRVGDRCGAGSGVERGPSPGGRVSWSRTAGW